jgi:chromosomal replication initiation ATPase DnaA
MKKKTISETQSLLALLQGINNLEDDLRDSTTHPYLLHWITCESTPELRHNLMNRITTEVCNVCGVTLEMLRKDNRKTVLVTARQLICFFCSLIIPDISIKEIGNLLNKTHSATIHNIDAVYKLIDVEDELTMNALGKLLPIIAGIKNSINNEQ